MIGIRFTLCRLETSYPRTLNDRYKVYTLQTRDFIPGTLNDRYKVYTLQTRDFIPRISFRVPPGMKSLVCRV